MCIDIYVDRGMENVLNSGISDLNTLRVPTEVFANRNHVKPGTVIKRLCTTGSYHGVRPIKLASGRLDWPDITVLKDQTNRDPWTARSGKDCGQAHLGSTKTEVGRLLPVEEGDVK
jgi:hypothetical protein